MLGLGTNRPGPLARRAVAALVPLFVATHGASAQNYAGILLADVKTTNANGAFAGPYAGSYVGPHSGEGNVLIVGGTPVNADNDYRGVVSDGGGDVFDGFGYIDVSGAAADRSVFRRVETIFTGAGGDSAFRWADTITNTSALVQAFTVRFGGDFGSDTQTVVFGSGSGYRVSTESAAVADPAVAVVWGGNGVVGDANAAYAGIHAANDGFFVQHSLLLFPGQSITLVHVAVLGAESVAGANYAQARALTLTTIGTGVIGGINGMVQIPGDPLLNVGCDQPGPIVNWYTPQSGEMINADVFTDANFTMIGAGYAGPSSGLSALASGLGVANDGRGAVSDGGSDAFDAFGHLHVTGAAGDRSVQRDVRPISTACDSAWRFVDTITNTSGATQTFDVFFGGDLGSDGATVEQFNGSMYRITTQGPAPTFADSPVAFIWGNNTEALNATLFQPGPFSDSISVRRPVTLMPGESVTFVHFALVADSRVNGWEQMRTRAQHLLGNGRADRLFAGIVASQDIVNWCDIPSCPGDYNKDGAVDLADLIGFNTDWQPNIGLNCP